MDISNYVNITGLFFDVVGAWLIFVNSPKNTYLTHVYQRSERDDLIKKADQQKKRAKAGFFLLFIGFIIQLSSNFMV